MFSTTKNVGAGVIALVLAVGLVACTNDDSEPETSAPPSVTETTEPETVETDEPDEPEEPEETEAETEAPSNPGSAEGVLQPGETATGTAVLPLVNNDLSANFSHTITGVDIASAADVEAIAERLPALAGMDVYYVHIVSHYVDGDAIPHTTINTPFFPVDASGTRLQTVTLIGWDSCNVESVRSPGDDPSVELNNCIAAVVQPGTDAPVALEFAQRDTPYRNNSATIVIP